MAGKLGIVAMREKIKSGELSSVKKYENEKRLRDIEAANKRIAKKKKIGKAKRAAK